MLGQMPAKTIRSMFWMVVVFVVCYILINIVAFIYNAGPSSISYSDLPADLQDLTVAILSAWLASYYISKRAAIKEGQILKIATWFGAITVAPFVLGWIANGILFFEHGYQAHYAILPGLIMNALLFVFVFSTTYLMLRHYLRQAALLG